MPSSLTFELRAEISSIDYFMTGILAFNHTLLRDLAYITILQLGDNERNKGIYRVYYTINKESIKDLLSKYI